MYYNIFVVLYVGSTRPLEGGKIPNRLELFDEAMIGFTTIGMMCFGEPDEVILTIVAKFNMGWIMIGFYSFFLFVRLSIWLKDTIRYFWLVYKHYKNRFDDWRKKRENI